MTQDEIRDRIYELEAKLMVNDILRHEFVKQQYIKAISEKAGSSMPKPHLYSPGIPVQQAAKIIDRNYTTVLRWVYQGRIGGFRIGARWFLTQKGLDEAARIVGG